MFATIIITGRSPALQVQLKYLSLSNVDLVDCCLIFPPLPPHFMVAKHRYRPDGIARWFPLHYFAQYQAESTSNSPNEEYFCAVDCCIFAALFARGSRCPCFD